MQTVKIRRVGNSNVISLPRWLEPQGYTEGAAVAVVPLRSGRILLAAIVPSFGMLAQMHEQGKVTGGVDPGERSGAFMNEVESFEELDSIMNHLPFIGIVKWTVKPIMPFASIAQQLPGYIADFRQQMQQGGAAG
jgi:antitoxin component of MazEF toxin-antitoxin module